MDKTKEYNVSENVTIDEIIDVYFTIRQAIFYYSAGMGN